MIFIWISNNFIEIFGAVTGIIFVFLEIRQTIWLWPVGFVISCLGWYWWTRGKKRRLRSKATKFREAEGGDVEKLRIEETETKELQVTRLKLSTGIMLALVFFLLYIIMWFVLTRLTDSPVPVRDSFITSLSIIATWMLARKIYEHWFLWIVVNFVSAVFFLTRGLYPTVILYTVYGIMSFVGLIAWKKTITSEL